MYWMARITQHLELKDSVFDSNYALTPYGGVNLRWKAPFLLGVAGAIVNIGMPRFSIMGGGGGVAVQVRADVENKGRSKRSAALNSQELKLSFGFVMDPSPPRTVSTGER